MCPACFSLARIPARGLRAEYRCVYASEAGMSFTVRGWEGTYCVLKAEQSASCARFPRDPFKAGGIQRTPEFQKANWVPPGRKEGHCRRRAVFLHACSSSLFSFTTTAATERTGNTFKNFLKRMIKMKTFHVTTSDDWVTSKLFP